MRNKIGQFNSDPRPEKQKRTMVVCPFCKKHFKVLNYRLLGGKSPCCSVSCASKVKGTAHLRGTITKEVAQKISRTLKGKYVGDKSPRWNGGVTIHKDGYVYIYSPKHPKKDHHGYVFEHRLVVEKSIGRMLSKDEHVHHKNGIKNDNRIENLSVFSNSDHLKEEWRNPGSNNFTNSIKSWFKKGQTPWNKKK